jgi:tetratricopeptide (TPR) repeat protein
MAKWTAFPHDAAEYTFDAAALKKHWARLHAGDAEPLPTDAKVLAAWALFHAGEFQKAVEAGLKAGENGAREGITVANKAQAIYANYLEKSEKTKLALFMEVAERAEAQIAADSKNANAHYFMAYALGRYSQGISIAKALAQGLGSKVKSALETTIKLAPKHADAHIALGAFHAEVIDKVGSLLGRTQGASKDTGLAMYKQALKLNPTSAIAMIEYANGLVMLEGDKKMKEAEKLYADAAAGTPMDAMERLDVEMAKAELED